MRGKISTILLIDFWVKDVRRKISNKERAMYEKDSGKKKC